MARELISGNLVVSGNSGTFESASNTWQLSAATNFTIVRLSQAAKDGSYGMLASPTSASNTRMFFNFIAAENTVGNQSYIATVYLRSSGVTNILADTDRIFLDVQTGQTVNSRTYLTGATLDNTRWYAIEIDITVPSNPLTSTILLELSLDNGSGGSATLDAGQSIYIDSFTCFRYKTTDTYGLYLEHRFSSSTNGNGYKWELYKRDYASASSEVNAGSTPLTFNTETDGEYEEAVIIAGNAGASIIAENSLFEYG